MNHSCVNCISALFLSSLKNLGTHKMIWILILLLWEYLGDLMRTEFATVPLEE